MAKAKKASNAKKGSSIKIRMYRVGFGDCFLLSLPVGQDVKHVLIDCGVHGQGNIRTINRAVDDIADVTGKKLALVIATHSHQDHISGFSDTFTEFEIDEVWLPWAEDPNDADAKKWTKKQAKLAAMLVEHFHAQAVAGMDAASTRIRTSSLAALVNLTSDAEAMGLLAARTKDKAALQDFGKLTSNAKAMDLLRSGFNVGAKVRYFEAGQQLDDALGIAGLHVRVLGPPRGQEFLSQMDPPADQEYLRLGANKKLETANKVKPFPPKWAQDYDDASRPLNDKEEKKLGKELLDASLDDLAFALDNAKNNTSLVTLFVYKGEHLLFPGDAQYGNWKYWLDKTESEDILSKITFLKVGHHGSHNATPRKALDNMTGSPAAMVSTQSVPWDVIPRVPLMKKLSEQTKKRVVRSDWIDLAGAPGPLAGSAPDKPAKDPTGFTQNDFWYDYEVPLT